MYCTMIKRYIKRPITVTAVQWDGRNTSEIRDFVGRNALFRLEEDSFKPTLFIKTLEGDMFANVGDFIIKGVQGEFYPCKEDVFYTTYGEITDEE